MVLKSAHDLHIIAQRRSAESIAISGRCLGENLDLTGYQLCHSQNPTYWGDSTVARILESREYTGCTVNFRTYSLEIDVLDGYVIHELIEAIYVEAPDKSSGHRVQKIHIKYNGIGFIPINELMAKQTA